MPASGPGQAGRHRETFQQIVCPKYRETLVQGGLQPSDQLLGRVSRVGSAPGRGQTPDSGCGAQQICGSQI